MQSSVAANPDRLAAIAARRSSADRESDLLHVGFDVAGETAGRRFRRPLRGATALRRQGAVWDSGIFATTSTIVATTRDI